MAFPVVWDCAAPGSYRDVREVNMDESHQTNEQL